MSNCFDGPAPTISVNDEIPIPMSSPFSRFFFEREAEPRTRPGASRSAAKHSCNDAGPWLA